MLTAQWIWEGGGWPSRGARAALAPLSAAYWAALQVRYLVHRSGIVRADRLALPAVGIGNLTVGGTGKTPVANWVARILTNQGATPAILLRGYRGGDEAELHRELLPEAIVRCHRDRRRAAIEAARLGADVAVLDDSFQRLNLKLELNVALVGADSDSVPARLLPAGPFREPLDALARSDFLIVTRKTASRKTAEATLERARHHCGSAETGMLQVLLTRLRGLRSGDAIPATALRDKRVLAVAGVARPGGLSDLLEQHGLLTRLMPLRDHQAYSPRLVREILQQSQQVDYVVITQKDAVKLRPLWPQDHPEPLVTELGLQWEIGRDRFEDALRTRVLGNRFRNPGSGE